MHAPLTYTAVGATRSDHDVPGYRRIRCEVRLGSGQARFWWIGAPVLRFYQERYTRRYLRALAP